MKTYDLLHGRRLRKIKEEKILRTLIICFFMVVCFCIKLGHQWVTLPSPSGLLLPSTGQIGDIAKQENMTSQNVMEMTKNPNSSSMLPARSYVHGTTDIKETPTPKDRKINYDQLNKDMCKMGGKSEFCDLKGDIRIDPHSPTVYYVVPSDTYYRIINRTLNNTLPPLTIKPYARNIDPTAMASVTKWSIKIIGEHEQDLPPCPQPQPHDYDSAAVIFSLAGYCGNMFHAMTDIFIPLFATTRHFHLQVLLLATNYQPWFIFRFNKIMHALSRYEVVDIDKEQQHGKKIRCFSRLTLGLKGSHNYRELNINRSESEYTTVDFKRFLRSVFSLNETSTAIKLDDKDKKKVPQLLIINRTSTRAIKNVKDVAVMATEIGFNVTVEELDANMSRTAEIVNSCDVMMGVHGAGLTNLFLLPDNAILIQLVPFGAEWVSNNAFGDPTKDMNLRYLEYKIEKHESSLSEKYPPEDPVFTDQDFLTNQGWDKWGSIYLDNQNVTVDLNRFRETLLQALMLLHD